MFFGLIIPNQCYMKKKILLFSLFVFLSLRMFSQVPNHINLYPNPASTTIHISFSNPVKDAVKVSISDILGNKIQTIEFSENESIDIDLTPLQLHNGLYLVKIETGGQTYLKRLLVKS